MTKQEFRQLAEERILILDGATGSNLLRRGMPQGVCTESWVSEHPDVMIGLQKEYIESGSDIIYAPTFSGNRIKLAEYGLLELFEKLNRALVGISKEAAAGQALVAGDITMTGAQLEPLGDLSFDELVEVYKEQIAVVADAGVDLVVVETMMSLQETRAAVIAAKEVAPDLPMMATLSFKETGRTLYGVSDKSAVAVLQGMGVDAIGLNCSFGPDKMLDVVKRMKEIAQVPVIAKPNAGMPSLQPDGTTGYNMNADDFAGYMKPLLEAGAGIIGGCCGSTPEFIKRIAEDAKGLAPKPILKQERILLATEREVFTFEPGQKVTVGRDIDFAADEELVEEYQEECIDTALDLAYDMEGCDILRISVEAEGIDNEAKAMADMLEGLSGNLSMPYVIATKSLETVEYVARHFSGIAAVEQRADSKEWADGLKRIAENYRMPIVTIDNEIIYC